MQTKINEFLAWYKRADVKFQIIKNTMQREFAVLVPSWCENDMKKTSTRTLRCHNVDHLDTILFRILNVELKKNLYNLYYSMGKYTSGIPYQNPNLAKRDNHEWVNSHHLQMFWYDWLIDLDADKHSDLDEVYESAKAIKTLLDKFCITYELRFSGCGFHFVVPYTQFAYLNHGFNPWKEGNVFKFLTGLSKKLNENYSSAVDWKIPDSRRLCKLPFSLAFYPNATYMCMPFINSEEFNNWRLEDMKIENFGSVRDRVSVRFNEYETQRFNDFIKKIGGIIE